MLIPIISSSSTINKPIDEKYIPNTIARTSQIPKVSQPDWNQNDPEGAGYIKGRTHYEVPPIDFTFEKSMLPDEVAFTLGDGEEAQLFHLVWPGSYPSNLFENMTCYWYDGDVEVEEKNTYFLDSWDFPYMWYWADYNRVRLILMDGKTAVGGSVPEAGIYVGRYANGTSPKFRIVHAGEIKPLSPKYLASNAPAANQQLVTDADGNAVWEEKTHYEVSDEINITFDGTLTGEPAFTQVNGEGSTMKYYLLSAGNYSLNAYKQMKVYDISGEEEAELETFYEEYDNGTTKVVRFAPVADSWSYIWTYLYDGKTSVDEVIPEAGIYVSVGGDSGTVGAFRAYAEGEVKPIDEKFIPDTIARKSDVNAPKDFIIFKDRSTGVLYYGGMDNGEWVTWCDIDHIEVVPVTSSKVYIEGMRVSPEDLIVTAVFVDGTSKVIDNYQFDNSKLTLETTSIGVIYSDNNGVEHAVSIPVTVTEMNPEDKTMLVDFEYEVNGDGTYTLTDWKQTYNGEASTEIILPDSNKVIL